MGGIEVGGIEVGGMSCELPLCVIARHEANRRFNGVNPEDELRVRS